MFLRIILSLAAIISACTIGACTPAHARPPDVGPAPSPTCSNGVVWHRSADITFCATTCTSDIDCASGERCRVLSGQNPDHGPVFADEVQEELALARADVELAAAEPVFDEPPACEGACAPYTGDLQIKPKAPTALCDPFHDVAGAMLSAADEAVFSVEDGAAD